jgi:hypothetical protein
MFEGGRIAIACRGRRAESVDYGEFPSILSVRRSSDPSDGPLVYSRGNLSLR